MPYVRETEPNKDIIHEYKQFSLVHQYDTNIKIWRFRGYSCSKCNKVLQNPNILPRHHSQCRVGDPNPDKVESEPLRILNVNGELWKPIDFNQI